MTIFTAEVAQQQINFYFHLFKICKLSMWMESIICTILHVLFFSEILFTFLLHYFGVFPQQAAKLMKKKTLTSTCILNSKTGFYVFKMSSHVCWSCKIQHVGNQLMNSFKLYKGTLGFIQFICLEFSIQRRIISFGMLKCLPL